MERASATGDGPRYQLSPRQRAVIARRSTRRLRCIREFPCSPDLLQHIVRDEKGRTDFIFDWQRLGRTLEIPVGFIGVLQAEELKAELTLCGVKLPAEDVPGSEPDAPPTLGKLITPILAAALLIGYVIHEVQTNDKLFLTFRGEQTTASITAFHPFHHLKGSRNKGQWVTYYHPLANFGDLIKLFFIIPAKSAKFYKFIFSRKRCRRSSPYSV